MSKIKKSICLLLVLALALSCLPLGALTAFAAESDGEGGSSGSETGDGGNGQGDSAGSGSSLMISVGVTMQVVYYRYDQCYNRYHSHGSVLETVESGEAIPWNDTGRDTGETETTVFDTFTLTPHTFLVKGLWNDYPYVYHFPYENLEDDKCTFEWRDFAEFWFSLDNPGGKPATYPRIVRNEKGGSLEIERFLARIILGNDFGAWDKLDVAKGETVETDTSLFASVLKYLGASDLAIQNYLDAYFGNLSVSQDGDALIPTIIWSWVAAENLSYVNRIYTIGDVAAVASTNPDWLKTPYTSADACNSGFGHCTWKVPGTDTMICKLMLGGTHYYGHNSTIWHAAGSDKLFGTGLVNRIQTEVDATTEDGTNTFHYLRGYWTPYGSGTGSVSIHKTNTVGTANLSGAEFTLYRDAECTIPLTEADYRTLDTSDTGYVSASVRRTDANGAASWTGLYTGIYFLKETKAPEGYRVNVDSSGKVEVRAVSVKNGETDLTLTNAENAMPVTLKKSVNAPESCIAQIQGNPLYTLAGAEYTVTLNGAVVETLVTDAQGSAYSLRQYDIGDVLTIQETKAPPGYKLDTNTYTLTVTEDDNVISVSDVPVFDPPFVLTKVDRDTDTPQGDGSFAGAVFRWEFYPNDRWSASPARTWYFATDANGRCLYSQDYLASGYDSDQLYFSPAGVEQLPLGTVKITEVQNSLGYAVIPDSLHCSILPDSTRPSGAKHQWTAESVALLKEIAVGEWGVYEPIDTNAFGSVRVEKYDADTGKTPQGDATFAGAKFQVINSSAGSVVVNGTVYAPGSVVCEITTDANGYAKTENILPIGTYTIRESAAPTGYLLNEDWKQIFSVTPDKKNHSFTFEGGTGCPDTVITGKIQITKKILNPLDGNTAPEVGASFAVTDRSGTLVDTIVTDSTGIGVSKALPYGTYSVTQIAGQNGTLLVESWSVTVSEQDKVYEYIRENPLWTASVSVYKTEAGTGQPLVASFELCQRMADGSVTVLESGTTGTDGKLIFSQKIAYTDGRCNASTYFIRETEAPEGFVLDSTEHPVSCTENNQILSVTVENSSVPGKLEVWKLSHKGEPMEGVSFLLEQSNDGGSTWNKVSEKTTDGSGVASWLNLLIHVSDGTPIQYRVTEVAAKDGYSLMPGPLWQGNLITGKEGEQKYAVVLEAVNAPTFEIPHTGSAAAILMPLLGTVSLFASAALSLMGLRRKTN